jgi:vacuolar-type H+-ATPase subunit I/STV1
MAEEQQNPSTGADVVTGQKSTRLEIYRIQKAFWLAVFGLFLAALLVLILLLFGIKTSSDIVAIVGLFTSVLGTLVGAFFGLQVGYAGNEKAEQKSAALLSAATPEVIENARKHFPEAFS